MKKPVAILSILLAIAVIVAGVFGVQKGDLSKEIATLNSDLTASTSANETLTADLDASAAKVAELEANAAAELEAHAAELAALEEAKTAELDAAAAKAAELEAKVAELTTSSEALAAELAALQEQAAADLAAATTRAEGAEADVAALGANVEALNAKIETQAAELAAAQADLAAAQAELEKAAPVLAAAQAAEDLAAARSYLRLMYKNATETTPVDYTVVGVVKIGDAEYAVEWTADHEAVKIVVGEDKMVTIDVDEKNPEEVQYVLTATLKSEYGATETVSFKHKVPAALVLEGLSYEEIVAAAYTLEEGLAMEEAQRLYGTVTAINTAWSEDYQNITVTIQIGDLADQTIQCYRLKGEGAKDLAVGDDITVEGILKNYKGTIEFDAGCVLVGYGEHVSQAAILDAAYALEESAAMTAPTALKGVISKIDTAWSEDYQNITVTIVCDGKEDQAIMCYRLKGEGAKDLAVGQEIAVAGTIKNYKGTIEFDAGCVLIPVGSVASVRTAMAAYTLEEGLAQDGEKTMTGEIVSIDTVWSEDYQNITVSIVPGGMEEYKIQCYRLKGEGAKDLAVGDVITVTGTLKNYKGTIEFDSGCNLDAVTKAE